MAGSTSKPKGASASTTPSRAARSAPRRPSKSVGVLDQRALDDAVAKAIAPLAQRLEDLAASNAQLHGDLVPVLELVAKALDPPPGNWVVGPVTAVPRRRWWRRRDTNALQPGRVQLERRAIEPAGEG